MKLSRSSAQVGAAVLSLALFAGCSGSAYEEPEEEVLREPVGAAGKQIHEGFLGDECDSYGNVNEWANLPLSEILDGANFKNYSRIMSQAGVLTNVDELYQDSTIFIPSNAALGELDPLYLDTLTRDPNLARRAIEDKVMPKLIEKPISMMSFHATLVGDAFIEITGETGDYVINGEAKVLCGDIPVSEGRIVYIIDGALIS